MGCQVTGVEPSAPAAARARRLVNERGLTSSIIEGFFEDIALDRSFDVVFFSSFCLSLIPQSSRRIGALKKARACLAPGGRVAASFRFRHRPPMGRPTRVGRLAGALSGSDWRIEDGDFFHGANAPQTQMLFYEHIFGPGEIEQEAAAAGLVVAGRGGHPHDEPFIVLTPA
jgi:SAM-dependent methyltransferase